jgi:hypothetical protein
MLRLRDALNEEDLVHFRQIVGVREDPTFNETKRRSRVNQISTDDTYLADQALEAFKALSQDDRERLISDIVWRVTCYVEGSITRSPGKGLSLEGSFRLTKLVQDGRPIFCVVKREKDPD